MKGKRVKKVSVVIPAYKAEKIIYRSLRNASEVLENIKYTYEIICVVDGKLDKTFSNAKKYAKKNPRKIKIIGYKNNRGKGHAVRYGMARATGDIIGFIDAGYDLNPSGLNMLLAHFEWYDADIIVGSKRHPVSKVKYPWQRKIMSFGYQMLVRVLFGLKIKDTQVGMKFYRREVLEKTLPRLLVKAWAFDIEMIVVANSLGFSRIYEAPIEIRGEFGGDSVLTSKGFLKTVLFMLSDTLAVYYRLKILNFYHYKNRSKWITLDYLTLKRK